MDERPKVGVAVIIKKEDKVLLGRRKGSHGAGGWQFPGGHLEFKEDIETCARREVLEETGLRVTNIQRQTFTNDLFQTENKHYITLFVTADYVEGEPQVLEPDKCEMWDWYSWDNLPAPLFLPIENLLKQGFNPFMRG
ncbi:MAG: NUDIX hydrolase [Chloroflexota bacterium]